MKTKLKMNIRSKKIFNKYVSKSEKKDISNMCFRAIEDISSLLTRLLDLQSDINRELDRMQISEERDEILSCVESIADIVVAVRDSYDNISSVSKIIIS